MRNKLVLLSLTLALAACKAEEPKSSSAAKKEEEVVTNRIAIPQIVRRNLGITFVKVERRHVARTVRVPGGFEHKATARADHRSPLAGRIELLVGRYDHVTKGRPLYRIDAPEWRRLQLELEEAELAGAYAGRRLGAGEERLKSISRERELVLKRIEQLEKLNAAAGGRAAELSEAASRLAQLETELAQAGADKAQNELDSVSLKARPGGGKVNARFEQALSLAAAWTGLSEDQLLERTGGRDTAVPRWKSIDRIEVVADSDGYVETIGATTGTWVAEGAEILAVVDHRELLFRGRGLQADIGLFRDGQPAVIVPAQGGSIDLQDTMTARLQIGIDADPDQRIFDLLLDPERLSDWARPGVAAFAEIVIDETSGPEPAIPLSCLMTDGLEKVFFMRDRGNPDQAVRVKADLGVNDGRWVAIRSGLREGDEVVLGGAYELKLTGGGKAAKGGHFHSDGTFHEAHD